MKWLPLSLIGLPLLLAGCASFSEKDTLASLRKVKIDIKEEKIEGSLDKAMESYRRFLEETPESALTPEAIRRLADLKVEKEYGVAVDQPAAKTPSAPAATAAGETEATAAAAAVTPPAAAALAPLPGTDDRKAAGRKHAEGADHEGCDCRCRRIGKSL